MAREESGAVERPDGVRLAYRRLRGRAPGVVFLGGFRSDMTGQKAETLAGFCEARGQAFLRLDYSGHGASGPRSSRAAATDRRWRPFAIAPPRGGGSRVRTLRRASARHFRSRRVLDIQPPGGGWAAVICLRPKARQSCRATSFVTHRSHDRPSKGPGMNLSIPCHLERSRERGMVAVYVAILALVLIGLLGLALDGAFVIARDGTILSTEIRKSSGYPGLDQAVVAMLGRASPVPPLPEDFPGDQARVVLPFQFELSLINRVF